MYLDFDDKLNYKKKLNSTDKFIYNKIKNVNNNINKIENAKNDLKRSEDKINNLLINKSNGNAKNKVQFKINNMSNLVNTLTNFNYNKKNILKQKQSLKLKASGNKKNAEIYSQNIDVSIMKEKPPKLPDLFFHDYTFNDKLIVKSNETFGKLNQDTIPVAFNNHLMINEKDKKFVNKKHKYFRTSATQRNAKKLLTVIYYSP